MYLNIGGDMAVRDRSVIGIFDLDNASWSKHTRNFLRKAEEEGMVTAVGEELPRSMVLCCPRGSWQRVYLSPLSPAALLRRIENSPFPGKEKRIEVE